MTLPLNGSDCLLRIENAESGAPPLLVGGLRLTGWTLQHDEVDITDGGDAGWSRLLSGAGLKSLKLQLSGLYLGSPGEQRLRSLAFAGAAFGCELSLDQGSALQGRFVVTELRFDSAINEEAVYAATLRSSGIIVIN